MDWLAGSGWLVQFPKEISFWKIIIPSKLGDNGGGSFEIMGWILSVVCAGSWPQKAPRINMHHAKMIFFLGALCVFAVNIL